MRQVQSKDKEEWQWKNHLTEKSTGPTLHLLLKSYPSTRITKASLWLLHIPLSISVHDVPLSGKSSCLPFAFKAYSIFILPKASLDYFYIYASTVT